MLPHLDHTTMPAFDRRSFLSGLAVTSGASLIPTPLRAFGPRDPSSVLRHAQIGVGGMGFQDLKSIASHPAVDVTALCDIDTSMFEKAAEFGPKAKRFQDWRKMFAEYRDSLLSLIHISEPTRPY